MVWPVKYSKLGALSSLRARQVYGGQPPQYTRVSTLNSYTRYAALMPRGLSVRIGGRHVREGKVIGAISLSTRGSGGKEGCVLGGFKCGRRLPPPAALSPVMSVPCHWVTLKRQNLSWGFFTRDIFTSPRSSGRVTHLCCFVGFCQGEGDE